MDNFDRTGAPVQAGALERLKDLDNTWQQYKVELQILFGEQVAPLNQKLTEQGLHALDEL